MRTYIVAYDDLSPRSLVVQNFNDDAPMAKIIKQIWREGNKIQHHDTPIFFYKGMWMAKINIYGDAFDAAKTFEELYYDEMRKRYGKHETNKT